MEKIRVTGDVNWDLMNWMPHMKADWRPNWMKRGLARSQPNIPSQGKVNPGSK
jgi:hypothetical protein